METGTMYCNVPSPRHLSPHQNAPGNLYRGTYSESWEEWMGIWSLTRAQKNSVLLCELEAVASSFSSIWNSRMCVQLQQLDEATGEPKQNSLVASRSLLISQKKHAHTHTHSIPRKFPQKVLYFKNTLFFSPTQTWFFIYILKPKHKKVFKKKTSTSSRK